MPTYYVNLSDDSTEPQYRWDEEIVKIETFPIYDNRVHTDEQNPALLAHTRFRITTRYTSPNYITKEGAKHGAMTYKDYKTQVADVQSLLHRPRTSHRGVASAPRVNSPNRGNKKGASGARSIKNASSYGPRPRCPKGFYYDSKRKMCVRIKGRNRNATKKKLRNGKRR